MNFGQLLKGSRLLGPEDSLIILLSLTLNLLFPCLMGGVRRQISRNGLLLETYSRNGSVSKVIPAWCCFLSNMQLAGAIGEFGVEMTADTGLSSDVSAFR